jgi:ABC-type transport system involved in multi-copper enzyme maturation permease subunit
MKNIITITQQTIQEAFARKVFIAFFIISSIVLISFIIAFLFTSVDSFLRPINLMIAQSEGKIHLDAMTLLVNGIESLIAMPLFGLGLFLSIFSVSSFIPNMLEKGHVDVILSKPVSRGQVLTGKFFGGLVVVFFNVAYLIMGIWFMLGLKFNVWDMQFLYTILTITFTFAVFYALIILVGVLSQNSILSMMVCYFIFLIVSPILAARETIFQFIKNDLVKGIFDTLYYILPKTSELGSITQALVKKEQIVSFQPFYTSAAFMLLTFGLSIFIFRKKDY